ncbi:MAG: cell division protein FtsQ/DivIB [Candidatus Polarisedimenticolaceae bacterium]|nr:cell division protein FtsQ/DivIB [Candidatus Polarisedimenticolaceae bacterium]
MTTPRKISQQNLAEKAQQQHQLLVWAGLCVLFLTLGLALHYGTRWLQQPTTMPLQHVVINGEFKNLQSAELRDLVMAAAAGGFFAVDMQAMRRAVEQQAWVDSASVRRIWPDTLYVDVVEQVPLARWAKAALINQRGEVFEPGDGIYPAGLPHLNGPYDRSYEVANRYRQIGADLKRVGLKIKFLRVNPRMAWLMVTEDGIRFEMGSQDVAQRLNRFIDLYPGLAADREERLRGVDLRYRHGFALQWQPQLSIAKMGV